MNPDPGRKQQIAETFAARFGGEPALWARAPGRVDLMGSHTDYNLGRVLTLPIDRDTWIAARPRVDGQVRLHSLNLDADASFRLDDLVKDSFQPWSNYVRGVASALREEDLPLVGFDGVIHGTVPLSSGLSSSAALECVTATIFEALGGWSLEPAAKALLCQRAENRFVGVNCGILDQYTSCAGKEGCALLLDCRNLSSRPVRIDDTVRIVICDTRSKRELTGSEYGTRRSQCEEGAKLMGARALREVTLDRFAAEEGRLPAAVAKRCRFIIEEDDRVPRIADALSEGDRDAIRELAAGSYRGACELFEIGAPSMESMMRAMLESPGTIGARQAGAGFGGCMVAFVEAPQVEAFARGVRERYHAATDIRPEVYPVMPAGGAGLL